MTYLQLMSLLCALNAVASNFDLTRCEILDLSHSLNSNVPDFPDDSPGAIHPSYKYSLKQNGSVMDIPYMSYGYVSSYEHLSTHMDAPRHFQAGGQTIDQIDVNKLVGEACVINIMDKSNKDPSYVLTVDDIVQWENDNGRLPNNAVLLMASGYGQYFYDHAKYFGSSNLKDVNTFKFPTFAPEVGPWLAQHRSYIRFFGVDTASFDAPASLSWPNHQALLNANIPGIENLKNLERIPARGATVIALPAKIENGTGAWVRVIAVGWNGVDDPCRMTAGSGRQYSPQIAIAFIMGSFIVVTVAMW